MNQIFTCEQQRRLDRAAIEQLGVSSLILMENAGRGCAEILLRMKPQKALILCGRGNNGGDGFVIARHFAISGVPVQVVLTDDANRLSPDATVNFSILQNLKIPTVWAESPADIFDLAVEADDVIVDAMLGTGSQGAPRGLIAAAIVWANGQASRRIAIDLPSGLCGDTGTIAGDCFQADETITMVAWKPAFCQLHDQTPVGRITVVPIGVPLQALLDAVGIC